MTLHASFVWKNPDATKDLNDRIRRIVHRGIVWGGVVNPAPSGLQVIVDPGVSVSFDGMTVVEDAQTTLTVAAGVRNYVVLWAKYNEGGIPALPTLMYQVMPEAAYNLHAEKDYLIVFCVVDLLPAAVNVTLSDIDFTLRDEIDPLGRDWYRGKVATATPYPGSLPLGPPLANRIGDFYFVDDENTFYFWNGTIWEPLNTGSYNSETKIMNDLLVQGELLRNVEGSGVICGPRPNLQGDFASNTEIEIVETPSVADQIGFDVFTSNINGHVLEVHGQYLALDAKPGIGERLDIVFLEMWREAVLVPETFNYARNPAGAATYNLEQAQDKVQQLGWKAGVPVAPAADNFDVNPVEVNAHDWRIVKYRIATKSNMPSTVCLYNPSDPTVSAAVTNVDGNPFSSQPAGAGTDERIWVAPSTTSSDGYSWAIPLFVIKRLSTENAGLNNAVKVFRDGVRHVFPVYPVVDLSHAVRKTIDTTYRNEPTPFGLDQYPFMDPSGILGGMDLQLETTSGSGTLTVYDTVAHIRLRGIEDNIKLSAGAAIPIPTAPTISFERMLVYLKMNVTLYDNGTGTATALQYLSTKHFPYLPSKVGGTLRGQGWKRGFVTFEYVVEHLGAVGTYLDEYETMVAAGWTRGDVTMTAISSQYDDGGIWSKPIAIDADERIHPYETEWAIPICLVHRRNSNPWIFDTNPNGSTGRPDGRTDPEWVYPDDLLDLRHDVAINEQEIAEHLEGDVNQLMKGSLRTRMANKYLGSGTGGAVAGIRILQTDSIGALGGAFTLTTPDGHRTIWSDGKEFALVSLELDLSLPGSSSGIHDWSVAGTVGTLTIKSPSGAHLVRQIPGCLFAEGDMTASDRFDFYGPPCWSSQYDPWPLNLSHASASTISALNVATALEFFDYNSPGISAAPPYAQPFKVDSTTLDAQGRATRMTGYVNLGSSSGTAMLSWWVHYDRTFAGPYAANYGLAEIPDTVHRAVLNPGGVAEDLHIGTLYTVVRKSVVASLSVAITAADITAKTGTPGVVSIVGFDYEGIRTGPSGSISSSTITLNNALDTLTLVFGAPFTGEVTVPVYYKSDIEKWIEVGRGGKSVRALFSWGSDDTIDLGATPPSVTDYTISLGSSVCTEIALGAAVAKANPIVWTKSSPANDWEYSADGSTLTTHLFSNMLSLKSAISVAALKQYVMIVWANQEAPAPSDIIQLDYTYTPYQGLSSTGGAPAVPATAVPLLKQLLHGTIEANTDYFVTQSGPTSYYSGVNTFTGAPANNSASYDAFSSGTRGTDRMSCYNRTALVSPVAPYGAEDYLSMSPDEKYSLNAAAILRLPFPMDPAMVFPSLPEYHKGVMDFDLDPVRAGAGAGFVTYAPGYPNSSMSQGISTSNRHRPDQYVNGLTRLLAAGDNSKEDKSYLVPADKYLQTTASLGILNVYRLESANVGDLLHMTVGYDDSGISNILMRTLTPVVTDGPFTGTGANSGVNLYDTATRQLMPMGSSDSARYLVETASPVNDPRWTSIQGFGSPNEYLVCTTPGIVLEQIGDARTLLPILVLRTNPSAIKAEIYPSDFTVDESDAHYLNADLRKLLKKVVDLVRVPLESYQSSVIDGSLGWLSENSITALYGYQVQYPSTWSAPTVTTMDSMIQRSYNGRGAGRGVYLGSTDYRFNMPMLVPGTGTRLSKVMDYLSVVADDDVAPQRFPYMPARPLFNRGNVTFVYSDIGGPIAYVFYGTSIRADSDQHKNKVVMQISGGPTGSVYKSSGSTSGAYSPEDLDGTALDAFWPKGRPLLKSKK